MGGSNCFLSTLKRYKIPDFSSTNRQIIPNYLMFHYVLKLTYNLSSLLKYSFNLNLVTDLWT